MPRKVMSEKNQKVYMCNIVDILLAVFFLLLTTFVWASIFKL